MVVNHFDVECVTVFPLETQTILHVDPYAVLTFSISGQHFKSIRRWHPQVAERDRRMQLQQFHADLSLDGLRQLS